MTAVERSSALITLSCSRDVSMVRVRLVAHRVKWCSVPSEPLIGCQMERSQASGHRHAPGGTPADMLGTLHGGLEP